MIIYEPYPYLKQTDTYVQTSVHEGYCIMLAGALEMERSCIATGFSGAIEQLEERKNCVIVNQNALQLATAVEKLVE